MLRFLSSTRSKYALVLSADICFISQEQRVVDDELYGDPNIDLEAEYIGPSQSTPLFC